MGIDNSGPGCQELPTGHSLIFCIFLLIGKCQPVYVTSHS